MAFFPSVSEWPRPKTAIGGDVDRRLIEFKHDDRIDLLPVGLRHGNLNAVVRLVHLYVAAGKKAALDDLGRQGGKLQHLVGPRENVQINRVALARRGEVLGRLVGAAARGIDALAVFRHPRPHLLEPLGLAVVDGAGRFRADVQQHIAVAARATDQHQQTIGQRFYAVFRPAPRPLSCAEIVMHDSHGRFMRKPPISCSGVS